MRGHVGAAGPPEVGVGLAPREQPAPGGSGGATGVSSPCWATRNGTPRSRARSYDAAPSGEVVAGGQRRADLGKGVAGGPRAGHPAALGQQRPDVARREHGDAWPGRGGPAAPAARPRWTARCCRSRPAGRPVATERQHGRWQGRPGAAAPRASGAGAGAPASAARPARSADGSPTPHNRTPDGDPVVEGVLGQGAGAAARADPVGPRRVARIGAPASSTSSSRVRTPGPRGRARRASATSARSTSWTPADAARLEGAHGEAVLVAVDVERASRGGHLARSCRRGSRSRPAGTVGPRTSQVRSRSTGWCDQSLPNARTGTPRRGEREQAAAPERG